MAKPWVATFDGGELVFARQLGLKALGQVYGCCVEAVSTMYFPATSCEAGIEAEAFNSMLEKSTGHMRQEASRLGANAVLGCRVEWNRVDRTVETVSTYYASTLKISGTAVIDPSAPTDAIYLASVDPCEVFALRKANYDPVGLAIGRCTYYQVAWRQIPKMTTGLIQTWANEEVVELTQGPYAAREIAMGRMAEQARSAGGVGVVGVQVSTEVLPDGTLQGSNMSVTCRFMCVGTAIRRKPGPVEANSVAGVVPIN